MNVTARQIYGCLGKVLRVNNGFHLFSRSVSSTSSSLVAVTKDDKTRTATLVLQRPPVNSLNLELLQEITAAVKDMEKDKCKGFILASSSPTVFSAGLDIMEMYQTKEERCRAFWKALQEMWRTLYLTPLYTVAAINGHCPAGGCMLSLSCDYSVMISSKATIGLNETKLGLMAPVWFQKLMINAIGFKSAYKALNAGTLFTPQQALSLNLVDELADDSTQVMEQARRQLELGIKVPAFARTSTKYTMRHPHVQELNSYADEEVEGTVKFILSDGVQKTLQVYLDDLKKK